MRNTQNQNSESNLRLTSFIDVIFILLLFFVVTSLIMKQSGGREGQRAYLKVQNVFTDISRVEVYCTVFIYQSGSRIKYRLIHKGAGIVPVNYFSKLARESQSESPDQNAIVMTTAPLLLNPNSPLVREMDRLNSETIQEVLTNYRKILPNNDLNFAIVAQPDIPFFEVIQLYSFMKMSVEKGGIGASQVILLEFKGDLAALLNRISWGGAS